MGCLVKTEHTAQKSGFFKGSFAIRTFKWVTLFKTFVYDAANPEQVEIQQPVINKLFYTG